MDDVHAVVIGAGFAGLQASLALKNSKLHHIVLEKASTVLHVWRDERWDTFKMNTPHWSNRMIGQESDSIDGESAAVPVSECLGSWDAYLADKELPVKLGCTVTSVTPSAADEGYKVEWTDKDGNKHAVGTDNVIIACGALQNPKIPAFASKLSSSIRQFNIKTYKNPEQLAEGGVLVVGAAQTGVQLADEFVQAGRKVYMATSKVGAMPRSYRGMDIITMLRDIGFLYTPREMLPPDQIAKPVPPQVGASKTINFHTLARAGVKLLGHLNDVAEDGQTAKFGSDLADNVAFLDAGYAGFCGLLEQLTAGREFPSPEPHHDPGFDPCSELISDAPNAPTELDLAAAGITNVLWATGLDVSYPWLHVPKAAGILDHNKYPTGPTCEAAPGIYWVGFYNERSMASNFLHGMCLDAQWVVDDIVQRSFVPAVPVQADAGASEPAPSVPPAPASG